MPLSDAFKQVLFEKAALMNLIVRPWPAGGFVAHIPESRLKLRDGIDGDKQAVEMEEGGYYFEDRHWAETEVMRIAWERFDGKEGRTGTGEAHQGSPGKD